MFGGVVDDTLFGLGRVDEEEAEFLPMEINKFEYTAS